MSEQHGHGHAGTDTDTDTDTDTEDMFSRAAYERRYGGPAAVWSGRPNPQLVAEVADLPAGAALDVGCGEGADAIWLAERGWRVTAVDFVAAALARAAGFAAERGAEVADRIDWVHADLLAWDAGQRRFDLVSAQFMQLPAEQRRPLFARLADAVAPGGTLLLVGHHPSDVAAVHRPAAHGMYTAEELVADLDADRWDVLVVEARPRTTTHPEHGGEVTIRDAVLRARRRD
jgi:SAM-dependent methyltransferase